MDWNDVTPLLNAPLDPRHVKPPPAGKYGEYVDGFHAITEANRIFGNGGWSYCIERLEMTCRHDATDRNGNPQVRVGYLCTVKVSVGGVCREGAAVGSGMAKPENEADAHESAVKEAETDALKRALRTLGYTFGLALYEKAKTNVRAPEPPFDPAATHARMLSAIAGQNTAGRLSRLTGQESWRESFAKLPQAMQEGITRAVTDRQHDIAVADQAAENMTA